MNPAIPRIDALTYASRADASLTDAELELVLLRSRALNASRGLTGVLLKSDHSILQYLEGPPDALARTFAAIERSSLHEEIRMLAQAQDVVRVFDRWHMGFATFQRMHGRMAANEVWLETVGQARDLGAGNPALQALLDGWDGMTRARRSA
jgi:hypothetical protein